MIKRIEEYEAIAAKANEVFHIDLYRTLNQPIEKRQPFENFIAASRTAVPELTKGFRHLLGALDSIERILSSSQDDKTARYTALGAAREVLKTYREGSSTET